jgi:hypothetical protein
MLYERSPVWIITNERVGVLRIALPTLPEPHRTAVAGMLKHSEAGQGCWPTTAEASAAIYHILSKTKKSRQSFDVSATLQALRVGAALDNVLDKPWVIKTMELLQYLEETNWKG